MVGNDVHCVCGVPNGVLSAVAMSAANIHIVAPLISMKDLPGQIT